MTQRNPLNRRFPFHRPAAFGAVFVATSAFCNLATVEAQAQITLARAVDLAISNSPKVAQATAEVNRSRAGISEAKDVYVPKLTLSSELGKSFGFPLGQPSVFSVSSQSIIFSSSQRDYIRAARSAFAAASLSLQDAREAIAADTALTFAALEYDRKRDAALREQLGEARELVRIATDRVDAGRDAAIDLTTAKLSEAQIRLAQIRAERDAAGDASHLARILNLPANDLALEDIQLPALPSVLETQPPSLALKPEIQAAYANARSKAQEAKGDGRFLSTPLISFGGTYSLFSNALNNYDEYYQHFQYNNGGVGVQVSLPIFDLGHRAKAQETAAAAASALHEADYAQQQELDAQDKLRANIRDLSAQAEVAQLEQQLAQQQTAALVAQLQSAPTGVNSPQLTPKDEQNSRIAERAKYLALLDIDLKLQQAKIELLRETGQIEAWLRQSISKPAGPITLPSTAPPR
jgi:outer membrane protein TolC